MVEAGSERERFLKNPLRTLASLTRLALITVDDSMDCWDPEKYPPILNVEKPVATEAELL